MKKSLSLFIFALMFVNLCLADAVNHCLSFDTLSNSISDFAHNFCQGEIKIYWEDEGSCANGSGVPAGSQVSTTKLKGWYFYAACAAPNFPKKRMRILFLVDQIRQPLTIV